MKKSELAKMVKEEVAAIRKLNEADVTLPAEVKRFMGKFVGALKSSGLNRKRQLAVLGGVINAMNLEPSKLMMMIKKIKRGMSVDEFKVFEGKLLKEDKLTPEQKKFAEPIFKAAAKKGGFKIKSIYMSRQPIAEIHVFQYGKDSGSLFSVWGNTLTQKAANEIGKAIVKNDRDFFMGEKSYRPKFKVSKDTEYLYIYEAAEFSGMKYDRKEYDRLFRNN